MINEFDWSELRNTFQNNVPYNHIVIDNFLPVEFIREISSEFPDSEHQCWYRYSNPIENKLACPDWSIFKENTYKALTYFVSEEFVDKLKYITGENLVPDYGLHGGGLHAHKNGGKNNVHVDYSVHPKLKKQRKLNLILYVTENWQSEWGGALELWSHDSENNAPLEKIKTVDSVFNRAVIFDTTQNSWHGLPETIVCPEGVMRKSLAVYYLRECPEGVDPRQKALFAPHGDQKNDPNVLEIIKKRSDNKDFEKVYKV